MATCKACGQAITWQRRGRKNHALDADGGNHFAHCQGRRKEKAVLEIRRGRHIVGESYTPSCGRCDVPPWEACACSALLPSEAETVTDLFNAEANARLAVALEKS